MRYNHPAEPNTETINIEIAHNIHYNSPGAEKLFTNVNRTALLETLLESELFGHEKGAFTSATERKTGKFERTHGGTTFLDETDNFPINLPHIIALHGRDNSFSARNPISPQSRSVIPNNNVL